jgi:hypothetical protein
MARAEILPLDTAFSARWDDAVQHASNGCLFARPAWLHVIARTFSWRPFVAALVEGETLLAGIPFFLTTRWGVAYAPPPPITLYNGCVESPAFGTLSDADAREALVHLLAAFGRTVTFGTLPLAPSTRCATYAWPRGWTSITQRTIHVDIRDIEKTWKGFSQSLRRKIRREDETGLRLVRLDDSGFAASLHDASYRRHAMYPPFAPKRIAAWLDVLHREGLAESWGAQLPSGEIPAMRTIVPDRDVAFDWLAGNALSDGGAASHWLVWSLMREYGARGLARFDFMGANTPGPTEFKLRFGGDVVPYRVFVYHRSRVMRLAVHLRSRHIMRLRTAR